MVIVHVVVACIVSELLDGSNFIQSAETIDETPWFRRVGSAYARCVKRDFQTEFASIPATSKDVGEFRCTKKDPRSLLQKFKVLAFHPSQIQGINSMALTGGLLCQR